MIEKKVGAIDFGLLSPDMIRKISAVKIVTPDTYDDDGYPIEGALMDLRLGVIDPGLRCKACGSRMTVCSGHFGHIELVRPVVHVGYVKMVYVLMKSTCKKCSRILLRPEQIEEIKEVMGIAEEARQEEKVFEVIEKIKKASRCPHCKQKQDKIKLLKPTTFFDGDQRLLPSQIRERLEKIPETDLRILGINTKVARPEWAVLTVLPVPPATTRPSITLETGERSEDDLTHKLVDVLRINQRLSDNISAGAPQLIIEDLWDLLQYHVTTYFNNQVTGIPPARHRSGRPLKTLFQRLKGKEGRFRYYLSGKRVNFSARTVISPDPNISIAEVGVPKEIAEELTIPEHVTEWNVAHLKKLVENEKYPTANYVVRPDGRRKKVTLLNKKEILDEINPGHIIERQLMDGDIVLFNRQPSLHRLSMMAHRVRVLPGKTFRMNDAVAPPYGADYDGDEMNLHAPQTEEARMEAAALMSVENQIVSVRHGNPLVIGELDHVTGAYLLTKKDSVFDKEDACWLLAEAGVHELPESKEKKYAGKDIFSMVIPPNITIKYKSAKLCRRCAECKKENCEVEAYVSIENGKIKSGVIESSGMAKTLLKEIYMKSGPAAAREFLDRATKLALAAIMIKGLTTSASDSELPKDAEREIKKILDGAEESVLELIDRRKKGKLERVPGKTADETLEDLIMAELGAARDDCGKIAERFLRNRSHAVLIAKTGAKGSMLNITQMGACIGQTALRGKRILRGYRNKTLPHFKEGDISAPARGFIQSSFTKGLAPVEFYFHSMSGRDSLVDKGIRTGISGYMQRRLINALLDISLAGDLSARDSSGVIIQLMYGEDGADPMKCYGDEAVDLGRYIS